MQHSFFDVTLKFTVLQRHFHKFCDTPSRCAPSDPHALRANPLKAAVHWVRVNALSAESSLKLTWDAMGLRADSARRLSVRAQSARNPIASHVNFDDDSAPSAFTRT